MQTDPFPPPDPASPRLTLEAWGALDEDLHGELVDGRLIEAEMPDATHETVVMWLALQLGNWAEGRGATVLGSGLKLGVADDRGRMPDLSVYLDGRQPPARGVVRVAPDIAVEVVSPSPSDARRDRVEKLQEYAQFGIRWYWLLDPELRTFEVWELRDGVYAHLGGTTRGVVRDIPGCPGLELDIDVAWARVDALPK